ncbi:MAG TPA: InlB B-repeat-containing protein, partial [Pirellulaceae bacterium]|nr:InlB B-repeat-containing protein [Pirellulaceae bacterium]
LYQFENGAWHKLPGVVDTTFGKIAVTVTNLGAFLLGVDGGTVYTITTDTAPVAAGNITGGGDYADGSSVTLSATANAGYIFANWTENGNFVSGSPNYTFTVHDNRSLTANFNVTGTGKIITTSANPANGGSTTGGGEYSVGASVTVSATANPGYKFAKWLENGKSANSAASYTFTVTTNRNLVAKFKPVYTLTVSGEPANGGEVDADTTYDPGDPSVMKAQANPGWAFVNWTQNGVPVSDDPEYKFTVNANRVLVGHFAPGNRIDTTVVPVQAGAVTGGGVHSSGASVTLEANAHPGYAFLNWTENSDVVGTSPTYSLTSNTNHAFVANFIAAVITTPSQPTG